MKLTVFGATGGTGKVIVEQALGAGHDYPFGEYGPICDTVAPERLSDVGMF